MAPSTSSYTLLALLVAFAVVTPSLLHQSAAARDGGAARAAAAAPAPSGNNSSEVVVHPTASYEIPDLPLPRILPCPPAFPNIPFIPCYTPPPPRPLPPHACRPSLETLMVPCSGFLTAKNGSAPMDPSQTCCDGVKRYLNDDTGLTYDPFCLCHILNGDVNRLLTAPVNPTRALSLWQTCLGIDSYMFSHICNTYQFPPMELPKPPPQAPANKA